MRILITGASGSGTTTLGKELSSILKCNFLDADDFYWLPTKPPYRQERGHGIRLEMMLNELKGHDSSVISGSIVNWGSELEDSFDLITFLYLKSSLRIKRLEKRELGTLGQADPEFLRWASEYDTGPSSGRSLSKHQKWLSERDCRILKLEGDLTVEKRCTIILKEIASIRVRRNNTGASASKIHSRRR